MIPCPRCGTHAPYVIERGNKISGAQALTCRNKYCRHNYNTLSGTIWHKTKLSPRQREELESLWRQGKNAYRIAAELGREYKWVWARVKQLDAAAARSSTASENRAHPAARTAKEPVRR